MARVPVGKRVRTKFLGGGVHGKITLATTVESSGLVEEWVVQDDIKIIGVQVGIEFDVEDAHTNTDTKIMGIVELSRAAAIEKESRILAVESQHIWNGVLSVAGDLRKQICVTFPEGCGIEVDEGETVNLLHYGYHLGAGGNLYMYATGLVYYVER